MRALVVPVKIYFVHGDLGADGQGQLATRNHVESQALFQKQLGQRRIDIGFAGVADLGFRVQLAELPDEAAAAGPQGVLVQYVYRRAVLVSQVGGSAPAQDQLPLGVDLSGIGENGFREHGFPRS